MKYSDTKDRIAKIAARYFNYMAKRFPVMCLNDEFSSFPRAEKAIEFLDSLDSFDKDKIRQDINYIKGLKASLEKLIAGGLSLEDRIDIALLGGSMSSFLREFERTKIWQVDPNIYIKIFLFGIDQLINRFSFLRRDIDGLVAARISQVPRLLEEAKRNLKKVPCAYLDVALEMVDASRHYFETDGFFLNRGGASRKRFRSSIEKALESLDDFRVYLMKKSSNLSFIKERALIEDVLRESFYYKKSLDEIFDIASRSHRDTLKALKIIAKEIDKDMTWQEILSDYAFKAKNV
ncbi:MAG: hypothetical protein V3S04_01780, partial [Candidatus Omnitrophota bacterium]